MNLAKPSAPIDIGATMHEGKLMAKGFLGRGPMPLRSTTSILSKSQDAGEVQVRLRLGQTPKLVARFPQFVQPSAGEPSHVQHQT